MIFSQDVFLCLDRRLQFAPHNMRERRAGVDVESFQDVGQIVYSIAKEDIELVFDLVFKGGSVGVFHLHAHTAFYGRRHGQQSQASLWSSLHLGLGRLVSATWRKGCWRVIWNRWTTRRR
eukprot:TRINITY_DN12406_c0_g1_i3.p1 TRINITY_DN12406_c0_g1~~TRINITY_DN12406_c0_g1_i3.p1  ORF type:complete len:120 (+),score=2.46 TRINITY_DN12406_c0_g1_i3:932-1291(+)